ncbi:MAG TPA: HdeD family acid-resistance protein [Actinomycetota bacterium]|nr:HdeD family acid-resistance protein [Actinomycetota bacterium]
MVEQSLVQAVSGKWWIFAVRGAIAVVFGVMALAWPQITILALVSLYGAYALVDGILSIVLSIRGPGTRWPLLAWGVLGVLAGIAVFLWPGITALVLVYLIAAWAIFTGIAEVAAAILFRKEMTGEWALGLAGLLSIVVGAAMAVFPGAGALSITWLIGAYAIALGLILLIVAVRIRSWRGGEISTA